MILKILNLNHQLIHGNLSLNIELIFDKIKCLEIILVPGKILYIPAYWWYTFKFNENTSVSCFKYRTYMNNIAISPKIFMYALQNQNVERKIAKPINIIDKLENKKDSTPIEEISSNIEEIIPNNLNTEIPDILIPKDDPEPMPQDYTISETIINNDNLFSFNDKEDKERKLLSDL